MASLRDEFDFLLVENAVRLPNGVKALAITMRAFEMDLEDRPYDYLLRYIVPGARDEVPLATGGKMLIDKNSAGSVQCGLVPFWSRILGKSNMLGRSIRRL